MDAAADPSERGCIAGRGLEHRDLGGTRWRGPRGRVRTAGRDRSSRPRGADGGSPLAALAAGSAFWLQASEAKEWWQLNTPPIVIFKRGLPDHEKARLQRDVDSVVGYFGRELGVGVSELRIRFGHDRVECGGYLARTVYLNDFCFSALAHEYAHALQAELAVRAQREEPWAGQPAWLTEGTAEYWSKRYEARQHHLGYENTVQDICHSKCEVGHRTPKQALDIRRASGPDAWLLAVAPGR